MENTQREAIVTVVEGRVRSFEAAERARDPERLIAHFASVPEFHFYHDGRRATYALMAGAYVVRFRPSGRSRSRTPTFRSRCSLPSMRL
jgi:hypothetical protein